MATKPAPAPATQVDPAIAWVDELGELEATLAPFKSAISRAEKLRKEIRASREACDPTSEIRIEGAKYSVILGARGNQTSINFTELLKRIKAAAFAKFATCTLDALNRNVDAEVVGAVTNTEQTGPRSITLLKKS